MLVPILLLALPLVAQEPERSSSNSEFHLHPDDPLHRFVELELTAGGATIDWTSGFDGTLHVWAQSRALDPVLAVTVAGADAVADDDSGGGTTAYVQVVVASGQVVTLAVQAIERHGGSTTVHWVASPETDETRAAVERAKDLLSEAETAEGSQNHERARALVSQAVGVLRDARGAKASHAATQLAWQGGFAAYRLGAIAACSEAWALALAARERTLPEDHPDLLRARQNRAATIWQQGDLAGARALEERVLATRERTLPEDHPDLLAARLNLAATMKEQGDLAGARTLFERVLEAYERALPADHPDLLAARQNLAATMGKQGDLGGARALEERVLEAYERALPTDHPDLLRARKNLAGSMEVQGDLGGARAIEERVVEARERTLSEDHPSLLLARQNLAVTMLVQGDLSGARALFERVLEAYERTLPDDHPDLNAVRLNLAITISQQGDLAGASALFERVLDAYERTLPADHPDVLRARLNLAVTMKKQGDLGGARALVERVLETYERTLPADHPELLRARQNLAVTIWQQGDLAGARALYERVLEANERTLPEDHPDLLHARLNVAVTMWQQGDLAGARALFERVLDAYERTLPVDHPDLLRARQNLAITRKEQGDLTGVHTLASDLAAGMIAGLESAAASLSDREARELVGDYAQRHSMVRFFSDPPSSARLRFDLAETLRDVGGAEARRDASQDPALDSLRGEIAQVRAELGDLLSIASDNATAGDVATSIEALTKQRDELQRKLRSELKNRGVRIGAIRSVEVARALPPGAVALGFVRVHDEVAHFADERVCRGDIVAAHFLRPNGAIVDVELGAASELEELVERWRSELGAPVRGIGRTKGDLDPEKRAGEALRERLLDPLLAELGDETTTLLVCAADLVHLVPLDALPLGDGRVGDRFRIVNQRSFRRLVSPRRELAASGEAQLLALGGAAFDAEGAQPAKPTEALSAAIEASERGSGAPARFEPLFFTGAEAERVKLLFEAAEMGASLVLTGEGATKAAFHEHAPGKRFVHVATHGWFAEMELDEPEEDELPSMRWGLDERVRAFSPLSYCGLAFAGANRGRDSLGRVPGIMTAEELAGVDLSACELAVLSACETNVGLRSAGMGIESLQSALHAAGARTAITSLWKVDDSATRKLMELFYTYLWVEKLPKAEALWRAKRDLRAAGAPLRHWAAWVLSGDPD